MILRTEISSKFIGWVETSQISLGSFSVSTNELSGEVDLSTFKADASLSDVLGIAGDDSASDSVQWLLSRLQRARTPEDLQAQLQEAVRTIVKARAAESSGASTSGQHLHRMEEPRGHRGISDVMNSDTNLDIAISRHIEAVGWEHLVNISSDMRSATLRLVDSKRREHLIEVAFPRGYPVSVPSVSVALPRPLPLVWQPNVAEDMLLRRNDAASQYIASDLKGVMSCVKREVEKFEGLIDALASIDGRCRVLEPARPSPATCTRRLALDRAASVTVTVDPDRPYAVCEMTFLGPTSITTPIRLHLQQNMHKWDEGLDVVSNLEAVLGVALPGPLKRRGEEEEEGEEEEDVSCAICYSVEDPEAASGAGTGTAGCSSYPDQICPNSKCSRHYHRGCLTSWMQSLPSSRMSFGTLFGSCPYCSENMSINLTKM